MTNMLIYTAKLGTKLMHLTKGMVTKMEYPFVRAAAASPKLQIADCTYNSGEIKRAMTEARTGGAAVLTFPELSITGYSCGDLFLQSRLLACALDALSDIASHSKGLNLLIAAGLPVKLGHSLYNCAAVVFDGRILGIVPKTYLPNYSEFYEKRWFSSSVQADSRYVEISGERIPFGSDLLFSGGEGVTIGVEVCEDLWSAIPPSSLMALGGANIILNLSASNELTGKADYRRELVKTQSARTYAAYCYAGAGTDESTTDVVYSGHCILSENGRILSELQPFSPSGGVVMCDIDTELLGKERLLNKSYHSLQVPLPDYRIITFPLPHGANDTLRYIDPKPFVPTDQASRDKRCQEIFNIQTAGLRKRLTFIGSKTAVIGISGGLDSTLALLAAVGTFDKAGMPRADIIGVTMPGFGTTDRTYSNAKELMRSLGISIREISIKQACLQHFSDIGHDPIIHDVTYENAQARERTQILMDISNKEKGLVVGTGDLSEIALGWSTYNGDHMSMYAINSGIPKTLIRSLVHWVASSRQVDKTASNVLMDIIDTPVSPELLPPCENGAIVQKTEEIVGPYELHDFFLFYMVRYGFAPSKILLLTQIAFGDTYSRADIIKWLELFYRRFFSQQFKRSCMPDGPKVGSVALSPRGDWRMPSDASASQWISDIQSLKL